MIKPGFPAPGFANRVAASAIIVFVIVMAYTAMGLEPGKRNILTHGDFPAFYGAAQIVHQGQINRLYDAELQESVQRPWWPEPDPGFMCFSYPPYTARVLSPLSYFGYGKAKILYTALMLACYGMFFWVGAKYAPVLSRRKWVTAAAAVYLFPVLHATIGAQNASVSMLLYAAALYGLSLRSPRGDWLCGAALGFWLLKPQYAVIIGFFMLLGGNRRIVLAMAAAAFAFYCVGAVGTGWGWPQAWVESLRFLSEKSMGSNPELIISISGVAEHLGAGKAVAVLLAVTLILALSVMALRSAFCKDAAGRRERTLRLMELLGPAVVLLAPRTVSYDIGLCFLPLAVYLCRSRGGIAILFVLLLLLDGLALTGRFWMSHFFIWCILLYIGFAQRRRSAG